jgi:hypothetical protein
MFGMEHIDLNKLIPTIHLLLIMPPTFEIFYLCFFPMVQILQKKLVHFHQKFKNLLL